MTVLLGIVLAGTKGAMAARQTNSGTNEPIMPVNSSQPGALSPMDPPGGVPDGGIRARMAEHRVKSMNDSRHQRLEDDVARLVSLTNELKSDLDKTTKDELSLEVMRKAQEIEKLAHDVQNRMKN